MRCLSLACSFVLSSSFLCAQTLSTRPVGSVAPAAPAAVPDTTIDLSVPVGTPIKIALDREVRVKKVGQRITGRVIEPVYSFDKVVVPRGTQALGTISQIGPVSKSTRTLHALNADFSPAHPVQVSFTELVLPDGRHLPIDTTVTPASSGVLEFVVARAGRTETPHQNVVSRNLSQARSQAKQQWDSAMQQVHQPGKFHKLERIAESKLPYHPQYLAAGVGFDANLKTPLDFGSEQVKPQTMAAIASVPPTGGVVHARLTTPLTSATAKKGEEVEAVLTEPLTQSNQLLLPVGARIVGSVLEVHPARRFKHNGELRILFHEVELPNGLQQKVESSLEGVEVSKGQNLALDAEGGAQVTNPHSRYFMTALQVTLATSVIGDRDAGKATPDSGGTGTAAANGASGFRLVGAVLSAAAKSRMLTEGFGVYGASMAVYSHFLARGNDVVYPKNMSMVIGLGTR